MKKAIVGVLGGVVLGTLLIALIFYILSFQSVGAGGGKKDPSKDTGSGTETGSVMETDSATETESLTEGGSQSELPIETEIPTETEIPSETEDPSETQTPSVKPSKPKNIPYYIKVNRQANCVTIYTKDESGNYTVPYKSMICSVGLNNRTPLGTYKISEKYIWRLLFGDNIDVYGYYTTRIVGHILFHSVPYTATSNDQLWENQYNMLGSPASKGCIRLSVEDAKWIYDNCTAGTTVEIYDSPDPGPLGRPEAIKISENSPYKGWDPTDPDPANPWNTGTVSISGVNNFTVERGEEVNLLQGVTATDVDGLSLSVDVDTKLDISKAGTYEVVYRATGVTGKTASQTATITVVDTVAPMLGWKNGEQTVTVSDTTGNTAELIRAVLSAQDIDRKGIRTPLDASSITVDMTALDTAIQNKQYGTYLCEAYATDAAGNKSNVIRVTVVYEAPEVPEPEPEPEPPTEPETGETDGSGENENSDQTGNQ